MKPHKQLLIAVMMILAFIVVNQNKVYGVWDHLLHMEANHDSIKKKAESKMKQEAKERADRKKDKEWKEDQDRKKKEHKERMEKARAAKEDERKRQREIINERSKKTKQR